MAEKREKRRNWKRAPAVLVMLAAAAALLTPAGA